MLLVERITALAAAIRDKLNTMTPRLIPPGGAVGQVLTKTTAADYAAGWSTSAGGAGAQQVFVQQTRPVEQGPWTWWVTNASGQIINLVVNDGT